MGIGANVTDYEYDDCDCAQCRASPNGPQVIAKPAQWSQVNLPILCQPCRPCGSTVFMITEKLGVVCNDCGARQPDLSVNRKAEDWS